MSLDALSSVAYGPEAIVIAAVHPDGGGSYAVASKDLGGGVSLLAGASLVVDYVLIIIAALIVLFARVENYYRDTGQQLGLGQLPAMPTPGVPRDPSTLVIVPVADVSRRTELALAPRFDSAETSSQSQ